MTVPRGPRFKRRKRIEFMVPPWLRERLEQSAGTEHGENTVIRAAVGRMIRRLEEVEGPSGVTAELRPFLVSPYFGSEVPNFDLSERLVGYIEAAHWDALVEYTGRINRIIGKLNEGLGKQEPTVTTSELLRHALRDALSAYERAGMGRLVSDYLDA